MAAIFFMNNFAAEKRQCNRWLFNRLVFLPLIGTGLAHYIDKYENYGGV